MAPRRNIAAAAAATAATNAAAAAAAIYPGHGDPDFAGKIAGLDEYKLFRAVAPDAPNGPMTPETFADTAANACRFEKAMYQNLVAHYLSRRSPYRSLLLFHQLGTGKTCTAISIAEGLLADSAPGGTPKIWVVSSEALRDNFIANVYDTSRLLQGTAAAAAAAAGPSTAAGEPDGGDFTDQCTGDLYRRMVFGWDRLDGETRKRKIVGLVRSRYRFLTYNGFAEEISRLEQAGGGALERELRGTLLIVDEAHNLRVQMTGLGADEGTGEVAERVAEKRAAEALETFAKRAADARIVLLTATPMYNEASEIMWLLAILTQNDKHPKALNPRRLPALFAENELAPGMRETLSQLASEYVSYIRGSSPFTFATRLRPDQSGIETLAADWAAPIRDGLVPTVLGAAQKRGMSKLSRSDAALFQGANVCYPSADGRTFKVGKEGFKMTFSEADKLSPLQVEYATPAQPLYPDAENLGSHGAKILRVAELLGKTKGIALVYSQFIWGGVVPLAVALEHMGYQRYGARPLLRGARLVPGAGAETRRGAAYAILSSDSRLMGDTHIRDLVADINRPENRAGGRIKVVLITPVAGEGISFRNVREVHILDPWYHLNRLDQVIGRAIRKCSHVGLPIDKRNVTIFLHTAVPEPGATEEAAAAAAAAPSAGPSGSGAGPSGSGAGPSQAGGAVMKGARIYADLNAYRIAAGKAIQVAEVERILRDNALDCALNREVNYFPQARYQLTIPMKTSRGAEVLWTVGDTPDMEPMCRPVVERSAAAAAAGFHPANYGELVETGIEKLRKLVLRASASSGAGAERRRWFSREELVAAIGLHPTVAEMVLREAGVLHRLRRGYRLIAHRDGFVLAAEQDIREARPAATLLRVAEKPPRAPAPPRAPPAPAAAVAPAVPGAPAPAAEAPPAPAPARDLAAEAAAAVLASLEAVGDAAAAGADLGMQTFKVYSSVSKDTWPAVAKAIIEAPEVPAKLRAAVAALEREGALVSRREIGGPLAAAPGPSGARAGNYIGYLDIFKKTKAAADLADGSVYDAEYGGYRDLTESERASVISRRRFTPAAAVPRVLMGVMEPQEVAVRGVKATRFVFKLWLPEETVGERRGIVCTSPKKDTLQQYLLDLGQAERAAAAGTKEKLCLALAPSLISAGRMIVYPLHKPPLAAAGGARGGRDGRRLKHKK